MDISKFKLRRFAEKERWGRDARIVERSREIGSFTVDNEISIQPSELQLNTITLVAEVNVSFDLDVIVACLGELDPGSITCPAKRESKKTSNITKSSSANGLKVAKKTDFYNSLTWRFIVVDGERAMKLAVKIFPNGRLQFAGFRSIKACSVVPHVVTRYLADISGATKVKDEATTPGVTSTRIHMIHTSFHLFDRSTDYVIKQKELVRLLLEKYRFENNSFVRSAEFNPSRHAGINIKWISKENQMNIDPDNTKKPVGQISIFVFESGATIITGGKEISDYKPVCKWLIKVLNENKSVVVLAKDWQKKKKKKYAKQISLENFSSLYNGAYGTRGKLAD